MSSCDNVAKRANLVDKMVYTIWYSKVGLTSFKWEGKRISVKHKFLVDTDCWIEPKYLTDVCIVGGKLLILAVYDDGDKNRFAKMFWDKTVITSRIAVTVSKHDGRIVYPVLSTVYIIEDKPFFRCKLHQSPPNKKYNPYNYQVVWGTESTQNLQMEDENSYRGWFTFTNSGIPVFKGADETNLYLFRALKGSYVLSHPGQMMYLGRDDGYWIEWDGKIVYVAEHFVPQQGEDLIIPYRRPTHDELVVLSDAEEVRTPFNKVHCMQLCGDSLVIAGVSEGRACIFVNGERLFATTMSRSGCSTILKIKTTFWVVQTIEIDGEWHLFVNGVDVSNLGKHRWPPQIEDKFDTVQRAPVLTTTISSKQTRTRVSAKIPDIFAKRHPLDEAFI